MSAAEVASGGGDAASVEAIDVGAVDGAADGAAASASAPAPLTSLSALLGGSFEGGAACAADGTCD